MSDTNNEIKAKVLIVEDNDFVRMQVAGFLRAVGHEVVEATDGGMAINKMDKTIDLAIVDVRMEPMGGFEFIQIIEGDGYKIPVVLLTGDQNTDLLERANQYSVSSVLLKPVQKDKLLNMVMRLVMRGR